ncbi:hypothetical protein ISM_13180 [Roseovarius nubinhibens ISM]|uniref:Uncharacterized protein n=1 Tax=Roseovarius nubinhibens (strain ATCC BAA-591 / DSM 15170 / ISM) TaxID=89187 RepID=A3SMY0_ROSNI|nr:hypothetical protein ISM_13180 [Roseovarius nubinhibens ISM]
MTAPPGNSSPFRHGPRGADGRLHIGVVRPVTALRRGPVDVLLGILDVTGLAVHAVLEVDDKFRLPVLFDHLIDPRRAVALRRFGIFRQVDLNRNARILELEVTGLAFLVVGHREADIGQPVKAQLAIGLGIVDHLVLAGLFGGLGIGLAMLERAKERKAERVGPHVETAQGKARQETPFRPHRLDVAHLLEVLPDVALTHFGLIGAELVAGAALGDGGMGGLGGGHARQHRVMVALDARHVDHAHRTAQQRHAGRDHLGHRLIAPLRDRPRAISHPLAAFEKLGHHRVMLEALELHIGEEMRVLVVQVNHETHVNLIVLKVIDERPAAGIAAQGPAHRMGDRAFLVLGRIDLPDLFHAETEFLRLMARGEIVFLDHFLGERAAHAFRQEDIFAMQLHPRLGAVPDRAIGLEAKHPGDDAFDFAIVAIDQLGTGHAREDLNAERLGLFGHPAADIAHRHDVIAVVVHQRRHREIGDADLARFAQHVEIVFLHRHVERRALGFPVGDELVETTGIKHRAREDMRPHFRPFFEHDNIEIGIELLETDRSGEPGRARTNDHDIIFHGFAFYPGHVVDPFPRRGILVIKFRTWLSRPARQRQLKHDVKPYLLRQISTKAPAKARRAAVRHCKCPGLRGNLR